MVRKAATVAARHLPADQRVDARRDQDVVDQRRSAPAPRTWPRSGTPRRARSRAGEDDRDQRLAARPAAPKVGPTDCESKLWSPLSSPKSLSSSACTLLHLIRRDLSPRSGSRWRRTRGSRPPGSSPPRRRRCWRPRAPERTSSTLAGSASAAWIRVPDSKSIPKLSCLVAKAIAPIARITPESEKKYREAPVKSKCHRRPSPLAPSERRRAQDRSSARAGRAPPG